MLENPPLPLWHGRSLRWSFWWSFWVEIELIKVAKELRPGDLLNNLKSDYHVHIQNTGETERSHSSWNKAHTSWCTPPGKYFATNQVLNSQPTSLEEYQHMLMLLYELTKSWSFRWQTQVYTVYANHIACKNITYSCFFFRCSTTPGKNHGGWILCFFSPGVPGSF